MAARRVPAQLEDLAFAPYLQPLEDGLASGGDYSEIHLDDERLDGCVVNNTRIRESAFTGLTFTDGSFDRTRFSDVWIDRVRWVGTSLVETNWLEATITDSAIAGVAAYGATLRRVTFRQCRISTLNLRGATLREVVFDRCEIDELDVGGASLTEVTFPGSALRRSRFPQATLKSVDFRGASELDVAAGAESLAGAVIDTGQLLDLAPALAHALGIVVENPRERGARPERGRS
jgi:uncharacterized protein YjbI with pentapeptide repeats